MWIYVAQMSSNGHLNDDDGALLVCKRVIILASAKTAAACERFMRSRRIQLATPPQEKQILSHLQSVGVAWWRERPERWR